MGPEVPPSAYTQIRSRNILIEEDYEEEAHFMNPKGKSLFPHVITQTQTCKEHMHMQSLRERHQSECGALNRR